MMLVGLTGSIGMGKSATAALFAQAGAAVYDADAAVHALYQPGGAAVAPVAAAFPGVVRDGAIERNALGAAVLGDPAALRRLEQIVHPLVRRSQQAFLAEAAARGARVAVLDVPLLFETGGDAGVAKVVVVSAPLELQRARVLARPGMTGEKLSAILAKQMSDAEKRARADFVIDTSRGVDDARAQVGAVMAALSEAA
jgi:dephospho-CoA kinase